MQAPHKIDREGEQCKGGGGGGQPAYIFLPALSDWDGCEGCPRIQSPRKLCTYKVAFRGISNDKHCTARGLCIITTILQANIGMIIVLISVIVDSVVDFIASRSGPAHWLLQETESLVPSSEALTLLEAQPLQRFT